MPPLPWIRHDAATEQPFVARNVPLTRDGGRARLEAVYPGQRVVDAEVAGMRRKAKPVNDPEIELFQKRPALVRDVVDIWRIGSIGNPVAQRGNIAMLYVECRQRDCFALPFDGAAFA